MSSAYLTQGSRNVATKIDEQATSSRSNGRATDVTTNNDVRSAITTRSKGKTSDLTINIDGRTTLSRLKGRATDFTIKNDVRQAITTRSKKNQACDFATTNQRRTSARWKRKKQACDASTTTKKGPPAFQSPQNSHIYRVKEDSKIVNKNNSNITGRIILCMKFLFRVFLLHSEI